MGIDRLHSRTTRLRRPLVRLLAQAAALFIAFPLVSLSLTATATGASPAASVTKFPVPAIDSGSDIIVGPDGAFWFADKLADHAIGRMTTTGAVSVFSDPSIDGPRDLTDGPDGAIWFVNRASETIGRITTAGVVTNFTDPGLDIPSRITTGSDGALWFINIGHSTIGRITTTGTVTVFSDPSMLNPEDLTAGPDGALWFTNINGASIGRITTTGVVTHFSLGTPGRVHPVRIVAGPDGALWFTLETPTANAIGRITTAGVFTSYPVTSSTSLNDIAAGSDGAVWFTCSCNDTGTIGRISPSGTITKYTDPKIDGPNSITAGPDGAMWFTDGPSIDRIAVATVVSPGIASVAEGDSGTTTLQVPITLSVPSTLTVTADWSTIVAPHGSAAQADPATDYTPASGTVTFTPGQTTQNATISVTGDTLFEPDEYIIVRVSNITNAGTGGLFGLGIGFGIIANDDHFTIAPGSAFVLEGNTGTRALDIPVTLSKPSTQTVTADWSTVFAPHGSGHQADPATDYAPASGTVTFAPGQTTQDITIDVNGDTTVEPDEYVIVQFRNPTNANLGGFYGLSVGMITNDD